MIDRREIMAFANKLGLRPNVIEKDYVLGWVLNAIFSDPELASGWVFKGGTCLKKCYFETYRFSEDLDFTVLNEQHLNVDFLKQKFGTISQWLRVEAGIELPPDLLRFDIYTNKRGTLAGEGRIAYRGPIAPGGTLPSIKLDLTLDEALLIAPTARPILHPYSDQQQLLTASCYAYEEIFGEKVRALGDRTSPRDLYDVINLFRHEEFGANPASIRDIVRQKCAYKGIPFPTLEALTSAQDELAGDWRAMLAHQLPHLPSYRPFWEALPEFFEWLLGTQGVHKLAPYPLEPGETVVKSRIGDLPIALPLMTIVETIRFAAINRLGVNLTDTTGNTHCIEPYSLRKGLDQQITLLAKNQQSNDYQHYELKTIAGVQLTDQSFVPSYQIELCPG